jgi:hypothetical protein
MKLEKNQAYEMNGTKIACIGIDPFSKHYPKNKNWFQFLRLTKNNTGQRVMGLFSMPLEDLTIENNNNISYEGNGPETYSYENGFNAEEFTRQFNLYKEIIKQK